MRVLDAGDIEASDSVQGSKADLEDDQRDILGEMEIVARLMITGGEEKEDARLTRADRSAIRQAILAAAKTCAAANRTVLTQDVRDALYEASRNDGTAPERRARLAEMAEAMQMFCMGADGEMFNREGTPWPEADLTVVDFATYAREGYAAQLGIAYISLLNTVNNIAERDQFKGRPIVKITDEGHIITKHPLLLPYAMKITKMWRKLGAWFWLATQNIDDIPASGAPMLNMIEWWLCLNMPPDEVEKISRFRELSPAQKSMMLSARKESGSHRGRAPGQGQGVPLPRGSPSLYLALAMTENEEKNQRYNIMQASGCDELEAALQVAADLDKARGLPPFPIVFQTNRQWSARTNESSEFADPEPDRQPDPDPAVPRRGCPADAQDMRSCTDEELQQIQLRAVDRRDIVPQIKQLLDEWLQQHPQPDTAQQALIEAVDRAEILQRRQA